MVITGNTTKSMRKEASSDSGHDLLTVHEVATILRVDDTTVRRWIGAGVLEAVPLPHKNKRRAYRIRRETVNRLFNTQFKVVEDGNNRN